MFLADSLLLTDSVTESRRPVGARRSTRFVTTVRLGRSPKASSTYIREATQLELPESEEHSRELPADSSPSLDTDALNISQSPPAPMLPNLMVLKPCNVRLTPHTPDQ